MTEQDIDLSEIPDITEEQMKRAMLRVGGKPVSSDRVGDKKKQSRPVVPLEEIDE